MNIEKNIATYLAYLASEEMWGNVDVLLPAHADDADVIAWARAHVRNPNANLCELAASIYEVSSITLEADDLENLLVMMRERIDNPYPRFRAACALAKRANVLDKQIVAEAQFILHEYLDDPNVSDIAKKYL